MPVSCYVVSCVIDDCCPVAGPQHQSFYLPVELLLYIAYKYFTVSAWLTGSQLVDNAVDFSHNLSLWL